MINKLISKKVWWYVGFILLALLISLLISVPINIKPPNDTLVPLIVLKILMLSWFFCIVLLSFFIGHLLLSIFEAINEEINQLEKELSEDEKEQDSE